jgi:hypothetical protein
VVFYFGFVQDLMPKKAQGWFGGVFEERRRYSPVDALRKANRT